jgi:hypothetical protein
MRTFVRFDKDGNILETTRVQFLPKGRKDPYPDLPKGESAIEVDPSEGLEDLSPYEIQTSKRVDAGKKRLVARRSTRKKATSRKKPGGGSRKR